MIEHNSKSQSKSYVSNVCGQVSLTVWTCMVK